MSVRQKNREVKNKEEK